MADTIKEYLLAHVEAFKKLGHPPLLYQIFLNSGQSYTPAPLPEELEELRGEMKMCFYNCFEATMTLAVLGDERYAYCEGFAYGSVLPVHHAWLTDGEHAYDLTWDADYGQEYYGVAFDPIWLENWVMTIGNCGVLSFDLPAKEQIALLKAGDFPREALWTP